jgi:hypothetical protein
MSALTDEIMRKSIISEKRRAKRLSLKRPKVIECGACGHPDYHCPASGCNHDECECGVFQQVTELELGVLERLNANNFYDGQLDTRVESSALTRLNRKGCLTQEGPLFHIITDSGRAVLLGTPPETLQSILGLVVEHPPTVASLAALTRDQREELRDWAGREHLSASDNPVRRRPRPKILDMLPVETLPAEEIF